jgi:PAS domain S-box-containing protein
VPKTAEIADFAAQVLCALSDMSARSHRHQADFAAALRGAALPLNSPLLKPALQLLQVQGCVTNLLLLSDGGLLLTVTRQCMQPTAAAAHWLPLDVSPSSMQSPRLSTAPGGTHLSGDLDAEPSALDYRDMFENAIEGIYRSSINGRQIRANPALVHLNGYACEADMLAAVHDIATEWYVEPGRRNEFQRLLHEHGRIENFVSEIYRHRTRSQIWISENARIVRDPGSGDPLYYEGTVREVTRSARLLGSNGVGSYSLLGKSRHFPQMNRTPVRRTRSSRGGERAGAAVEQPVPPSRGRPLEANPTFALRAARLLNKPGIL